MILSNAKANGQSHLQISTLLPMKAKSTTSRIKRQTEQVEPVKLPRSQWPRVTSVSRDHQDSYSNSPETSSQIHINHSSPLIHTDKLTTSSKSLYIHTPNSDTPLKTTFQSSFPPARVAILSASYAPNRSPPVGQMDPLNQAASSRDDKKDAHQMMPKFEVLNLEVSHSSATLSWRLSLSPADSSLDSPDRSSIGESELKPTARTRRQLNVSSHNRSTEGAQTFPRVPEIEHKLVKRDTIRVTPTLTTGGHDKTVDSLDDNTIGKRRSPESSRSQAATGASSQNESDANDADVDHNDPEALQAHPSQVSDNLRETNERLNEDEGDSTHIFSIGRREDLTADDDPSDLVDTNNERIQLNRLQPLAASLNKRPPLRNSSESTTSSTTSKPSDQSIISRIQASTNRRQKSTSKRQRPKQVTSSTNSSENSTAIVTPEATAIKEPQVIKIPSVQINRISTHLVPSSSSSTTTTTTSTTQRPRSGKSIGDQLIINSTSSSQQANSTITSSPDDTSDQDEKSASESVFLSPSSKQKLPLEVTTPNPGDLKPLKSERFELNNSTSQPKENPSRNTRADADATSEWLVRLRKFASNEVDIVKIIVNELSLSEDQDGESLTRRILFKELEPSSAYEICVESASPNQLVADRYKILNANHFLKCRDTTDVDLKTNSTEYQDHTKAQRPSWLKDSNATRIIKTGPEQEKFKSLCREFFTLGPQTNNSVSFGQSDNFDVKDHSNDSSVKVSDLDINSQLNSTANLRKPKSLSEADNTLKSRLEILEINEPSNSNITNLLFEVATSRSIGNKHQNFHQIHQVESKLNNQLARPILSGTQNYLTGSLLPIVGCVFAIIFMLTLSNILLSSVRCRSSRRRSRRNRRINNQPTTFMTGASGGRQMSGSQHSGSEHSGASANSQSRFVVVGKYGEPFGSSSAYFDVPSAKLMPNEMSPSVGTGSTSAGSGAKLGGYLIPNAVRFPLGPSFEGDENHNADMVGLARRNYDNFINNIYNEQEDDHENGNAHLNSQGQTDIQLAKSRHHHQNKRRHIHKVNQHKGSRNTISQISTDVKKISPTNSESAMLNANRLDARARVRFDKINPIYNMDGLYASPRISNLSSFGQPERSSGETLNEGSDSRSNHSHEAASRSNSLSQHPDGPMDCSICELNGQQTNLDLEGHNEVYFNCCLDRQKQRIQEQQQQLGLVMSKNGSLIPQPFISAEGPGDQNVGLESQSCMESMSDSLGIGGDQLTSPTNERKQMAGAPEAGKNYFVFGELESDQPQDEGVHQQVQLLSQSPPPPPPPPLPALSLGGEQASNLNINVVPMDSRGEKEEIINKSDFEHRREQLASKLHLPGMTRP